MKLSHIAIGSCLAGLSSASSQNGYIFPFDLTTSRPTSASSTTLSSRTAQFLLAHRFGNSDEFVLEQVEDDVVGLLNQYGGVQRSLLGDAWNPGADSKLLVVVEGIKASDYGSVGPNITVSSPQDLAQSEFLGELLQNESRESSLKHCSYIAGHHIASAALNFNVPDRFSCPAEEELFPHIVDDDNYLYLLNGLQSLARRGVNSWASPAEKATLKITFSPELPPNFLHYFIQDMASSLASLSSDKIQESTILILPQTTTKSSKPWSSFLNRRQQPRQEENGSQPEEPLSQDQANPQSSSRETKTWEAPEPLPTTHQDAPVRPTSTGTPNPLTYPLCSSSNSTCQSATDNCSNHGVCVLKSRSPADSSDSKPRECWSCKCTPTVTQLGGGSQKVTYWAGPACQKKDVSMPFWLLGGVSVALVGFVAYGIGLLIDIGGSELPSVLGAGVSSVRNAK